MWHVLRDRRFAGIKFRRQHPIGRYIVDFYCVALRLAIELDGKHHEAPWMADYEDERIGALQSMGITVLRISNELLKTHPHLVGDQIAWAIARRKH